MLIASKEGTFLLDREGGEEKLRQLAGNEGGGAGEVRSGRLRNGKRFFVTVEPMHGSSLVAYTPPTGEDAKGLWSRQVLDESLVDGHALGCGDFAETGGDQVVVGWRAMGRPGAKVGIKLFSPLDADGKQWKQTLIDDNTMACEDLLLADLNDDGKLDIIAAGRATKNLKVYLNEGMK
jgi:hypothetical protein